MRSVYANLMGSVLLLGGSIAGFGVVSLILLSAIDACCRLRGQHISALPGDYNTALLVIGSACLAFSIALTVCAELWVTLLRAARWLMLLDAPTSSL